MIENNLLLAICNAVMITGIYWACVFDWKSEIELPIEITRRNATPEMIKPDSKMLLWKIRFVIFKIFGWKWSKPIITCPICMSSVHSTYVYFSQRTFNVGSTKAVILSMFTYIAYVLMVAGFGAIITHLNKSE